jgi:hypothetical protein
MDDQRADRIRATLFPRERLLIAGWSDQRISRAVGSGRLVRVHRGWYAASGEWSSFHPEERHLAHVIAVHAQSRGGRATAVGVSAAVLHGLPLYRTTPRRVHIAARTLDGRTSSSRDGVARHEFTVARDQLDERYGVPCTSLARTVLDVARSTPVLTGVACADAALRRLAWDDAGHTYDADAAERFRTELEELAFRAAGGRGIRSARFVISFADGRADRPGESVSRVLLHQLGFAPPRLQVAVAAPHGGNYYVDFGLDECGVWGEFDGDGKYSADGRDPEAAWREEKVREDWIRGVTGRPFARWGSAHLTIDALGARLAAFGIRPRGSSPHRLANP